MPRKTKEEILDEDLEQEIDTGPEDPEDDEDEEEEYEEEEVDEETEAAATLKPKSKDFADPKSKIEVMNNVIGHMASMKTDELCKWWNQTVAQVGSDHFSKAIPDGAAAHNKASIDTKPSDAVKESVKDDLKALFDADKTLTEEAKERLETIFEAAVSARVLVIQEEMEAGNETHLEEAVDEIRAELEEKLDSYLNYVTEQWMTDNEVAVESALRSELTEEFIEGLKALFEQHYIDIPQNKVDVIDALSEKVEELEAALHEVIQENNELKGFHTQAELEDAIEQVAEGLTVSQTEKLASLCEDIEFDGDIENFKKKVGIIKEAYFKDGKAIERVEDDLEKTNDELNEETKPVVTDPRMKLYTAKISQTLKEELR